MSKFWMPVTVAMCMSATVASAATFDFQDMANSYKSANAGHEADFNQYAAYDATLADSLLEDGGISIIGMTGAGTTHALFDGDNNDLAGVGVCSSGYATGGLSQCSSNGGTMPGDDNMTMAEVLEVTFSTSIMFDSLQISGTPDTGNGHALLDGTQSIIVNGNHYDVANGFLSAADLLSIGSGDSFTFQAASGYEIYLNAATVSDVPLPAGAVLLLSSIGGLAVARRRNKG